jgi:hypothetical protein
MERGELDATSVSARVVDLLGRVLGIGSSDLLRTGMPAAAAAPLYRRDVAGDVPDRLDLLADGLTAPVPEGEWDEVDELFFGHS